MAERSGDWMRQAEADLQHARNLVAAGFERGAPVDFYTEKEAREAIAGAEEILEYCRGQIDRHGKGAP